MSPQTKRSTRRLVLTTVVVALLATVLGVTVSRIVSRVVMAERLAVVLRVAVPESALRDCRAGYPRSAALDGGIRYHFYDAGGLALSADAPPIDERLRARLRDGRLSAGRFDGGEMESRALGRLEDAGVCAFSEARWPAQWATDTRLARTAMFALGLMLLVAAAFGLVTHVVVVRPLLVQIEDKSRALESLLGELTHDIKTPLASVQFALDDIAEDAGPAALPSLRRALSDVVYMRSLTNNLRLAARIRAGNDAAPARGPIDLGKISARVAARVQPFALRRGIALEERIERVPTSFGDEVAVEQAIGNVLENAVAHGEPGMRVSLSVTTHEEGVRIVVEDDGPGVVPEELPRLGMHAFREDEPRARDGKGGGLGLAITRAVCERERWCIRFEPNRPRGLRVVIETR